MLINLSELTSKQKVWWEKRWPNFPLSEVACPCCGEIDFDLPLILGLDKLQKARNKFGKPLYLNSCHRCWRHNILVKGAPLSMHKKAAFDVSTRGYDRFKILELLKSVGFTTFGLYKTFIHTDIRHNKHWYGSGGKEVWNG